MYDRADKRRIEAVSWKRVRRRSDLVGNILDGRGAIMVMLSEVPFLPTAVSAAMGLAGVGWGT